MAATSPAFFEIDENDKTHVDTDANKDLIRQRRERLHHWLEGINVVPPIPDAKKYHDFVTYSDVLLATVRGLVEALTNYAAREELKRPVNVLLQAPPGSGKSSLVRSICRGLSVPHVSKLLEINFSNLLSPGEATAVFDRVQLLRENGMLPVAFFDEIDVPEWSVYQYMLMPMWDGAYMAHGRQHVFARAIFFLAASPQFIRKRAQFSSIASESDWIAESRKELATWLKGEDAPKKAADFYSRIDFHLEMPPMRSHFINSFVADTEIYWQDLEIIQLARFLIRRLFPKVEQVDARVFEFLAGAFQESKREVERILFLATVPIGGAEFMWNHLPKDLLDGGRWFQKIAGHAAKPIGVT